MRKYTAATVIILTVTLFVSTSLISSTHAQRIKLPPGVFYYQPAASVYGAEAAWINPAGLSRYHASSFQVLLDYYDESVAKSWGTVVNREGLAIAKRKVESGSTDYSEWVFAGAAPLGNLLHFGISYRYFNDAPDELHKDHLWNIGLVGDGGDKLKWAAVFSNLNRTHLDGDRSETEMRYSLAYRPMGSLFTLAVDMFLSTKTKLRNADFVYHAELNPAKGLYVNGYIDSDKNFQVGVRANLLKYFTGARTTFSKSGDHLGTTIILGAVDQPQPSVIPPPGRRLAMTVTGSPSENPPRPVIGVHEDSFIDMLLTIYRAAEDPSIAEMVLSLNRLGLGFGQAQELRDAMSFFRSYGKKVICHLDYPNNIAYYVASAADSILIPPVSQLNLVGLRAELTFYTGAMEKLGIEAELLRIGDYKSGAEPFTRHESSEEYREQVNDLLDNLYRLFIGGIAKGRGLTDDSVSTIIDNGPYTSQEAIGANLVDGLSYRDELDKNKFLSGMPEISFRSYQREEYVDDNWRIPRQLAVVVASGDVNDDSNSTPLLTDRSSDVTPAKMKRAMSQAMYDPAVDGIVFRINSPGGWAVAGDEIYHEVDKAARKKLTITSMSDVAASAGYYMAMPTAKLFANPSTVTGSIGIFGGKINLSGLYDKIDIGKELYTRGRYAGMLTSIRPFTEEERQKYFEHLRAMYHHFVKLVADNRKLAADSVDNLGRGKVWTGRQALKIGLVDSLGGLRQSLEYLARELNLDSYSVKVLPEKRPFIVIPGRSLFGMAASLLLGNGADRDAVDPADKIFGVTEGILARMPYDITIE